jgi:hypothetical protein
MRKILLLLCACVSPALLRAELSSALSGELTVQPAEVMIIHPQRPQSVLVAARTADGYDVDLTAKAVFRSSDTKVATVDPMGWVQPVADGDAVLEVEAAGKTVRAAIRVRLSAAEVPVSFRHDVMPVLSKGSCNMGACHGYSLGKNGFKLSLRGADPDADYLALTEEFVERRINRNNAPASLLLLKALGDLPHEGGVRIDHGTPMHRALVQWIAQGAKNDPPSLPRLESIRVHPQKVTARPNAQHQFQVTAHYSDHTVRDVTREAIFTVNTERVAKADDLGLVSATDLGETAIIARYENLFAVADFVVLPPDRGFKPAPVPADSLVDAHVIRKLNTLRINPSEVADDAVFLRRVYLDLIGIQPKPEEVEAFLVNPAADKREKVVDALFARNEFVDWWSLRWGDLLQNSRNTASDPAVYAFREWIRAAVASNMPMNVFAREILTARGSYLDNPAAAYFTVSKDTDDTMQRLTQVFCGVRMLCARCHPHPFENWTQADYYGVHSFFNQVGVKPDPRMTGVTNAKTVVLNLQQGFSTNPRTTKAQPPRYLGANEASIEPMSDRRAQYAQWLVAADNPHFARSLVNRMWSYFFHRGIIDPVDDLRSTSPPINEPLLAALTKDFVEHRFNVRHLMRTIVLSRTYQRSSVPNDTNAHDDLNFSRAIPRRIPAEALLDSLVQATGVKENFAGVPATFSAAQLPDGNVPNNFLSLFGKAQRSEACECERDLGSNMLQALHFINGKSILSRVSSPTARPALLIKQKLPDPQLLEQLYLWSLARKPSLEEMTRGGAFLASYGEKRAEAAEDLMWALLNSRNFTMLD